MWESTKTCGHKSIWWPADSICCRKSKSGENIGRYLVRGLWCLGKAERLRSLLLPPSFGDWSPLNCWLLLFASVELRLSGRLAVLLSVLALLLLLLDPLKVDISIFDLLVWFVVNNSQLNSEFASDSGREEVLWRFAGSECKWFVSNSGCEWRC